MSVKIKNVAENSPAFSVGVKKGDILVSLNGNNIADVLDYMFYAAEINVKICVMREDDKLEFNVWKSEYDDLGLEFETFLMDKKQCCTNKCIFCFIDQLPPGMRETLYFKDDDERLSFLQGNYVTLTNLDISDIERIVKMKLNINVSVHTTNPELRCKMMTNRFAGEKLKYLKILADGGITMNCQIVLCPEINDGKELERTLNDLAALMPHISSIAVVPVGITKFRKGLYPMRKFYRNEAADTLDIIEAFQMKFLAQFGTRLVFPADEFYITAKRTIPEGKCYEDYCQYENGVGMLRSIADEFTAALKEADAPVKDRSVTLVTGTDAFEFIKELVENVTKKWHNIKCNVVPVVNNFFGDTITVSGLLTGQDIYATLKDKELGDALLMPTSLLKRDTELLLDDYTVSRLEDELNIKIQIFQSDGYDLLDKIIYG